MSHPGPDRRSLAALACGLLLAATQVLGACTVSNSSRDDRTDVHRQALASNRLHLDLTDGLTRQEAGIAPGRGSVAISHTGSKPLIDVTIELPGGRTLRRDVGLIAISGERLTNPEAKPTSVELLRQLDSLDAARAELDRAVEALGLSQAEVDAWAEGAARAVANGDATAYQTTVFRAEEPTGDVMVEVDASLDVEDEEVGIRHIFNLAS